MSAVTGEEVRPARVIATGSGVPLISHHRGGYELAPPETIEAYRAAVDGGAEMVEFDVWRSADGVFYVFHDERREGVRLADLDWDEIHARWSEIPTVAAVLEVADGRTICHVDLKHAGHEDALVELLRAGLTDAPGSCVITTTLDASVRFLRLRHPEFEAVLSVGRRPPLWHPIRLLRSLWHDLFPSARLHQSQATGVAVQYRLFTPWLRRFRRRTGIAVMVWTVNDTGWLRRFVNHPDVDVVITDYPIAATALRDGR